TANQRDHFLRLLSAQPGTVGSGDRICVLVQPHAEVLGVLAFIDPDEKVNDDDLFALQYGSSVLGLEFSHQRNLADLQLNLRRELGDDLPAGTDHDPASP